MSPIYIFDLDGTLANAEHRLRHIQGNKKDWRAFFAACIEDAPILQTIATFKRLDAAGAKCWIWTGRSDEVREQTITWLDAHGIEISIAARHEFLLMRPKGDHQPDHALKLSWLSALDEQDRARLVAVFEDRDQVVGMWREAGLTCYQAAPGDF